MQFQSVCHSTLPWLISFSLDGGHPSDKVIHVLVFLSIGVLLILAGMVYFYRAHEIADMMSQQMTAAHPFRRLWLPARFCTSKKFFWQLRIAAVGAILTGLVLIASTLGTLIHHQ